MRSYQTPIRLGASRLSTFDIAVRELALSDGPNDASSRSAA